jgi:hypothetical protein
MSAESADAELLRKAAAATRPSIELMALLWMDTLQAERALQPQGNQYARRQYVRSVFAMIEGMVFATKQLALASPDERMDTAENAMLQGVTYDLDDRGKAVTRTARLALEREIRFAFRMYAKSVGLSYELDISGKGWQALVRAKIVRDRLTHPKKVQDLTVSDAELDDAKDAGFWFREQHAELQEVMVDHMARSRGLTEVEVAEFRKYRKKELERRVAGSNDAA